MKTTSDAKRKNNYLRDMPSQFFQEQPIGERFREFVTDEILPTLELAGYKLRVKEETAIACLHNLVLTGSRGQCVSDGRDTRDAAKRLRAGVWDSMVEADYASLCLGSESSCRQTLYRVRPKLSRRFKGWQLAEFLDLNLERNSELDDPTSLALVVLHTGTKNAETNAELLGEERRKPLSLPKQPRGVLRYIKELEDRVEAVNDANLDHAWKGYRCDARTGKRRSFNPDPRLRVIYTREMGRGGRLYGLGLLNAQSMPKVQRESMIIGGEETAELDFSGMATRCLYHIEGINPKGDVYRPGKVFPKFYKVSRKSTRAIVRDFVKTATNISLNAASVQIAAQAVRAHLKASDHHDLLCEAIYRREKTDPMGIVERIQTVNPKLKHRFFTGVGVQLMSIDGGMMLLMLERIVVKKGLPALGIHDAICCRQSDVDFVRRVMVETYRLFFGFSPKISRVS